MWSTIYMSRRSHVREDPATNKSLKGSDSAQNHGAGYGARKHGRQPGFGLSQLVVHAYKDRRDGVPVTRKLTYGGDN